MKKISLLAILFIGIASVTSCKKKGCTDSFAENFDSEAEKDDGTCTFLSDQLLGTYAVDQQCYYGGSSNYSMTVIAGSNKGEVILQGLDDSINIKATIDGTNFNFSEDKAGITYEGSGYKVGENGLTINLEICETFYYPCSDPESCTLTCTK